jgi:hypothetical protein
MMPDFHLPRFNDCRNTYLPAHGDYYEYAYARFSDPAYLPVIYRSREMAAGALAAGRSPNVFDQALLVRSRRSGMRHGAGLDQPASALKQDMTCWCPAMHRIRTSGWR